ncbi:sulfate adenylyltransferase subunit 2 [bacterium]|jgi:sulfate adenylyltransferase subunit 2|nr:sulfate adenylyltransferase subunit 2 [bacterium]MBT3795473.1 sulfate adenylyltransferase subunit 2 [bacterium]MBT4634781.1 sulfate adenylyltransferase subunit 2 [bacterium]
MKKNIYLKELESEAIFILREVVAEFKNPVMLYSVGKDSSVMLHLARKAFFPSKIPFPLLHVDTGYKFREMYEFRDSFTKEIGANLIVYRNEEAIQKGFHPSKNGIAKCCGALKTQALLDALSKYNFNAAIGGARRDEEKSRAKERIFSFRDSFGQWNPKSQKPELWNIFNGEIDEEESVRIFPLSSWTETDIWNYIKHEGIKITPLYFARNRNMIIQDNSLVPSDDINNQGSTKVKSRFRSLGCMPCTGAIRSDATDIDMIIEETIKAKRSERETRIIDHGSNSMEDKKREGYF